MMSNVRRPRTTTRARVATPTASEPPAPAPPTVSPARRPRSATVSRMDSSAEISIGIANTIALPPVATGQTNAPPAPSPLLGTGAYHFNRRRPKRSSLEAVPTLPDVPARGTERFPLPPPTPDDDPVPADIEVRAGEGEVRLQVGALAIRCSPATATWIARALLEAARGSGRR